MKGQTYLQDRKVIFSRTLIVIAVLFLCACSSVVHAQWTQPNGSGHINSTNTGNVGVGTPSPSAKLTVSSNANTAPAAQPGTTAQIVGADGASARLVVDSFGPVASSIDLRKANNTALSPTAVGNNEILGQITWQGRGATSYNAASRAKIMVSAAETYTDTAQGAFMTFSVAPIGAITSVEAMRIAASGFIGLGTTAPTVKLDVFGTSAAAFRAVRDNATTDTVAASAGTLLLYNPNTTANNFVGLSFQTLDNAGNVKPSSFIKSVATARSTSGVSGDLAFSVNDGASVVEALRLTSGSRVGIGISTPNFKLDVQGGQINSSGGLCIAGVCKTDWSQVGSSQWANGSGFINYSTGYVGIGTATPNATYKLDVQGGSINSSGGLCIAGDCKTAWLQAGAWSTSGSNIYYNSGNIGVGTNNPTSKLFVGSGTPAVTTLAGLNVALGGASYVSASNGTENVFMGADGSGYGILGTLSNHGVGIRTNNTERLRIDTAGNVGLGTGTPTEKLEVNGNLKLTGTGNITAAGTIEGGNIKAKYQDVAEWVDSSQELNAGTVVILDSDKSNNVVASISPYDSRVAGVISVQPGITLGEHAAGRVLVATTGRVKVKVDASNGPIKIGDLLVTSDKTGVAMKSVPVEIGGVRIHRPGTLIGKALEPLAAGTGEILVLLSLQ